MTLKRYETLRKFLHGNDNDFRNNPENQHDKLFKMRRLPDLVRNDCMKIELEKMNKSYRPKQSIVEGWNSTTRKKLMSGVSRIWWEHVNLGSCKIFLGMAENIVLEQNNVERKNQFVSWWKRSQRIKNIEFSSIIGSQPFHFLLNYNPWVFYQLQHGALIV